MLLNAIKQNCVERKVSFIKRGVKERSFFAEPQKYDFYIYFQITVGSIERVIGDASFEPCK